MKWLGYEKDEIVGKVIFSDLFTAEGKEMLHADFPLFKERGEIRDLGFRILRKDGTVLPVLLNATSVRDDKGDYLQNLRPGTRTERVVEGMPGRSAGHLPLRGVMKP